MKTSVKYLFFPSTLTGVLISMLTVQVTAQTFKNLHAFNVFDGGEPEAGLVCSGNLLYGTALLGGTNSNSGMVFRLNTDGTGFIALHYFESIHGYYAGGINADGTEPFADLLLSGDTLYGTTEFGGMYGWGTVFAVKTNGADFTTLHHFTERSGPSYTNIDGANIEANLMLLGNTLYGAARGGGGSGSGAVFAINADGTGFTNLYSFTEFSYPSITNSEGFSPSGLILSAGILYGTARLGGISGSGTVFAVNTNGMGITNLHSFSAWSNSSSTNSDGAFPQTGLILADETLFGTTYRGGNFGSGTIFAVKTNGTGFTNLHSFGAVSDSSYPMSLRTNSDGALPGPALILSGNMLYGTASTGGSAGAGTIFGINTDGTGFTNLYSFTGGTNGGAAPFGDLTRSGNTLYGTTYYSGNLGSGSGVGIVFSFSLPLPQLTIALSGTNVVLRWPVNPAGFTLQSATNLISPTIWSQVSPLPVIADGQNAVTNPISGSQKLYRLSQ